MASIGRHPEKLQPAFRRVILGQGDAGQQDKAQSDKRQPDAGARMQGANKPLR